jgi:hypothetical protein
MAGSRAWAAARSAPCPGWSGRERRAEVAVVGVFGRHDLALPVGERVGEGPVPDGQAGDPLVDLAGHSGDWASADTALLALSVPPDVGRRLQG